MDTVNVIRNVIRGRISRYWWNRYRRRDAMSLEGLERFPIRDRADQLRVLQYALHAQIKYFGRRGDALPEWRDAASIDDPAELWKVWPHLPIVDREMLQNRFYPDNYMSRFGLMGIEDSTGGSTGEPTQFFHDEGMLRAKAALILYARLRMGWKPHLATIIVWGSERDIGKQISFRNRMNNTLFRNYLVDGYHLSRQTVERVLLLIRRHKPVSVYGFSSMLEFVAHEALSMNACTPAGTVYLAWNGGEMLFPDQNKAFQKAFGVPILNVYGGRELSVMACQYKADDLLHVQRPWNFIELVDDAGKPVGPGEPGRVICTSTVCRGTPFLRYEIGDSADYDAADCDDTGIRALRQILGRVGSVVVLPDGRRIQNLYWNHLMKGFKEVRQFQIRVKNDGRLIIMLKGKAFSDEREAEFRHIVSGFLGDLYLEFKWVDAIPLTPQGKLVQVIRDTT